MNIPTIGHPITMPSLDKGILKEAGAIPIKSEKALQIEGGLICTTGEVECTTAFEMGFSWAEAKVQ